MTDPADTFRNGLDPDDVARDIHDSTITPTPHLPTSRYYEIPVVFVVDAMQRVEPQKDASGTWGGGFEVEGSERDAAELVCDALQAADFSNGSEATPWLDCWTMPANQDVTGADNRSGTIVYGSDCSFLAALCDQFVAVQCGYPSAESDAPVATNPHNQDHVEDAVRLRDYLRRYTFNG